MPERSVMLFEMVREPPVRATLVPPEEAKVKFVRVLSPLKFSREPAGILLERSPPPPRMTEFVTVMLFLNCSLVSVAEGVVCETVEVPRALECSKAMLPAVRVVFPEYELFPLRIMSVVVGAFSVMPPVPLTDPPRVTLVPENVRTPDKRISKFIVWRLALLFVTFPPNVIRLPDKLKAPAPPLNVIPEKLVSALRSFTFVRRVVPANASAFPPDGGEPPAQFSPVDQLLSGPLPFHVT